MTLTCLFAGDIEGNYPRLAAKVKKLCSKRSFDLLFIVGVFFPANQTPDEYIAGMCPNPKDSDDTSKTKAKELFINLFKPLVDLPCLTYVASSDQSGNAWWSELKNHGCCKNIFRLSESGKLHTIRGLRVAAIMNPKVPFPANASTTHSPLDILLCHDWPKGFDGNFRDPGTNFTTFKPAALQDSAPNTWSLRVASSLDKHDDDQAGGELKDLVKEPVVSFGCNTVRRVALQTNPRYLFTSKRKVFFQLPPYTNSDANTRHLKIPSLITRTVKPGSTGISGKSALLTKSIFGLSKKAPQVSNPINSLTSSSSASSTSSSGSSEQLSKLKPATRMIALGSCNGIEGINGGTKFLSQLPSTIKASKVTKWIHALGLVPMNELILEKNDPITASKTLSDPPGATTWLVTERFISIGPLTKQHAYTEIIPLKSQNCQSIESLFIERGKVCGVDFTTTTVESIRESLELREAERNALDYRWVQYFIVDIPSDDHGDDKICTTRRVMVHKVSDQKKYGRRFPLQFGRSVCCTLTDCEERVNWKNCVLSKEDEETYAQSFEAITKTLSL
eukprot:g2717.t1